MNVSAALARLARAGITPEPLTAQGVDSSDPVALRTFVDDLLADVTAGRVLASHGQVAELTAAQHALWTPAERAANELVGARLGRELRASGVLVPTGSTYPCDADVHAA